MSLLVVVPLRLGLLRMAEIVERGWNAGAFEAFDSDGFDVPCADPRAARWSVFGASGRAAFEMGKPIGGALDTCGALDLVVQGLGHDRARGWSPIREWERDVMRTQAEVAGGLRMAAGLAPPLMASVSK
jgi:hypothetical protein